MLACSQGYISPVELTATARAAGVTAPTESATPLPTALPTLESTSLPTITMVAATNTPQPTRTPDPNATPKPPIQYYTQSGDTLAAVAGRFGVLPGQIEQGQPVPAEGLISPNILLIIPDILTDVYPSELVMPDSEVVYSPSAVNFDIQAYVSAAGGYLSRYKEDMAKGPTSGADIVQRVALENSINPRLLLALLEYKSHWVFGEPGNLAEREYPMGRVTLEEKDLYHQLSWAVSQLSIGYYGWRAGSLSFLPFRDGTQLRVSPGLNAGSAAVQYLFAQWYGRDEWLGALYGPDSMPALMEQMFGNFFLRAESIEPLYSPDLRQPVLELPFVVDKVWSLTGGPHSAWGPDGALAALDFAPPSTVSGCASSQEWVTAMAPGVVVRADEGAVIVDMDFDGVEQTGWNILYMHVGSQDRVAVGTVVQTNDHIGHPSCEGGVSTGTHVHVARKFNGEWILAGGPMPYDLSGFIAHNGDAPYLGFLTNGSITVVRDENAAPISFVSRPR